MPFLRSHEYHAKRFHPQQELAWLGYKAGKDLVLPQGRRSGKSSTFAEIQIEDVEETGYPSLFTAISQSQARRIIWPKLTELLKHQKGWRPNESRLEFVYKGGPFISVKGADLRSNDLAGGAYRTIACDEYALWNKPEIKSLILAPMLVDYDGQFLIGSTKRGKNHFWKLHQEALANPDKYCVVESNLFDNPFISEAGKRKVIDEYPGGEKNPLYRQEILNEYVVFEGMIFALDDSVYVENQWDQAEYDHSYYWMGMDLGFSPDPTAAVFIAYNHRRGYFQIFDEYKQHALLIKQHAEIINAMSTRDFIQKTSDNDPQVLAEFASVGMDLTPATKTDKVAQLLRLVNMLRTGKLKISKNCTQLLEEMSSLTWEDVEKKTGEDHLCDAMRYGVLVADIPALPPKPQSFDYFAKPKTFNNQNSGQDFG